MNFERTVLTLLSNLRHFLLFPVEHQTIETVGPQIRIPLVLNALVLKQEYFIFMCHICKFLGVNTNVLGINSGIVLGTIIMAVIIHVGARPRKWFPSCGIGAAGPPGLRARMPTATGRHFSADPELLNHCKYVRKKQQLPPRHLQKCLQWRSSMVEPPCVKSALYVTFDRVHSLFWCIHYFRVHLTLWKVYISNSGASMFWTDIVWCAVAILCRCQPERLSYLSTSYTALSSDTSSCSWHLSYLSVVCGGAGRVPPYLSIVVYFTPRCTHLRETKWEESIAAGHVDDHQFITQECEGHVNVCSNVYRRVSR